MRPRRKLRILAGITAAAIGTIMLYAIVNNRDNEQVGEVTEFGSVVVVKTAIPRQTPVESIIDSVEIMQVPTNLINPGAVATLGEITPGYVTSTELLPGEQLLSARFRNPEGLSRILVPNSLQEVTIPIFPERAVGGAFNPGDTLGVIASFGSGEGGENSSFILHRALVTAVQFSSSDLGVASATASGSDTSARTAPTDQLLVTFAVSSVDAVRLVFAAEFGSIWLSLEGPGAKVGGEGRVTLDRIQAPQ
ncbi:MAG: RcpC/CpaB family pilus assembly protein [Ilumatobacteraceae bacterium]